jgi:hypothetical protein
MSSENCFRIVERKEMPPFKMILNTSWLCFPRLWTTGNEATAKSLLPRSIFENVDSYGFLIDKYRFC